MDVRRKLKAMALAMAMILATLLFYVGCDDSDSDQETAQNSNNLRRMENCDEALGYLRDVEMARMEEQIEYNMSNPFDYWDDDDDMLDDDDDGDISDDDDDDDTADDDDSGDDDSSGDDDEAADDDDEDHSDTNVQEDGVDEADLVKTDGKLLVMVTNGHLLVIDPTPADQTRELGRIAIDGWARELFLYKDYVLVFSAVFADQLPDDVWPETPRENIPYEGILKLTVISIAEPAAPEVVREDFLEGQYLSSRRVSNAVRVALWTDAKGPQYETWIDPWEYCEDYNPDDCDLEALNAAYLALLEQNRLLIEQAVLEDWLPRQYQIINTPQGPQVSSVTISECVDLYRPADPQGTDVLSILSIDLEQPEQELIDIGLIADGSIVYASTSALYVTTDYWQSYDWLEQGSEEVSLIHKFDIASRASEAVYQGTGAVNGWVLNQFSLSEYDGYLRAATTTGAWGADLRNHVYVLEQGDMALDVVGELHDLAPGEEIKAARFQGERGFLVTFEQTDPLFTLDMSDPSAPKVVGQLQMPGYSAYLHPFGEDHLLGFGLQGDEWGSTWGVKLSLFDVSDFADPQIMFNEDVGGYDAWSLANQDHKSFLYYADKDLLAFPYMEYGYGDDDDDDDIDDDDDKADELLSALRVYRVTLEDGFEFLHDVEHTDYAPEEGSDTLYDYNQVLRGVVIGDYIYSISNAALVATSLDSWEDVAKLELPFTDPYSGSYDDDDDSEGGDDEVDPD